MVIDAGRGAVVVDSGAGDDVDREVEHDGEPPALPGRQQLRSHCRHVETGAIRQRKDQAGYLGSE